MSNIDLDKMNAEEIAKLKSIVTETEVTPSPESGEDETAAKQEAERNKTDHEMMMAAEAAEGNEWMNNR